MIKVKELNGFIIMQKEESEMGIWSNRRYVVFHPIYDGTFIQDYPTLKEAEQFCTEEDIDSWTETLL